MNNKLQDSWFEKLNETGFVDKIGIFSTLKYYGNSTLGELKQAAILSNAENEGEVTPEIRTYQIAVHETLLPICATFNRIVREGCWGKHYQRRGDIVSLTATEALNKDGTIADPHAHIVYEYHDNITPELVYESWAEATGTTLSDNAIDVQYQPFEKGPKEVMLYTLKQITPYTLPDLYPRDYFSMYYQEHSKENDHFHLIG